MVFGVGPFEHLDQIGLFVEVAGSLGEFRLGDAGGAMATNQHAIGVFTEDIVQEDILRHDHIAFHAKHFGDVDDAARAVAQTGGLDHHINGRDEVIISRRV